MISNNKFYLLIAQYETNFPWRNETFYCSRSVSGPHRVCKSSNAPCAIGCSSRVFRTTDKYDVWISVGLRSFLAHCRHETVNAAVRACTHSLDPVGTRLCAPPLTATPVVPTWNVLWGVIPPRTTQFCLQLKIICRRRTILDLVQEVQHRARELTERSDSLCRRWPWLVLGRMGGAVPQLTSSDVFMHLSNSIPKFSLLKFCKKPRRGAPLQKPPVNIPRGNNEPNTKRTLTANGIVKPNPSVLSKYHVLQNTHQM